MIVVYALCAVVLWFTMTLFCYAFLRRSKLPSMSITDNLCRYQRHKPVITPKPGYITIEDDKEVLNRLETALILCFAFTGNCAVLAAYSYPSGFYLEFLQEQGINNVIGTIAISTCQVTTVLGPYMLNRIQCFKNIPLKWRSVLLCVSAAACSAPLASIDCLVKVDKTAALLLMGVLRALLGFVLGTFFVIVQGEVVDRYFKDNRTMMVLIGSGVYAGNTIGGIIGTELFVSGGWTLTGLVAALLNLLPLLFLPFIRTRPTHDYCRIPGERGEKGATEELKRLQKVVFYLPDIAFFVNNVSFSVLIYVVPIRMLGFRGQKLDKTVFELNTICCSAIFLGLAFAYLTSKKLNVFYVMIVSNVIFHLGCLLMYISTTEYLSFPYDFEISSLMVGFGDATLTNLIIMSKFVMYEKWKVDIGGIDLGQHATTVFNVSDALGYIVGTIASSLTMTKSSEKPTIALFFSYLVTTTLGLIVCKIV